MCAKSCSQEATHCDTLAAWSLRLDTGLVTDSTFLQTVQPGRHATSDQSATLAVMKLITVLTGQALNKAIIQPDERTDVFKAKESAARADRASNDQLTVGNVQAENDRIVGVCA